MGDHVGILALDMATSTGWALLGRDGSVTSGVQSFDLARGDSPGMRFLRFRRWLHEMLTEPLRSVRAVAGTEYVTEIVEERVRAVDVIAYERAHHRGGAATALCVGLATVMLEEAARLGIETTAVATTTLKKHAAGKGNAGKGDMTRAAMKRWGDRHLMGRELTSDDEADALCVLAWSMDEIGVKA